MNAYFVANVATSESFKVPEVVQPSIDIGPVGIERTFTAMGASKSII